MTSRDDMLTRIRAALRRETSSSNDSGDRELVRDLRDIMPPIPPGEELTKFEAELTALAGVAWRAASGAELEERLESILTACGAKSVALSRNSLLARLGLAERLRSQGLNVSVCPAQSSTDAGAATRAGEEFRERCFTAEVGITGVDFVLAETGSLVVTSASEGAQLTSLAPPVHVALYRREQLVASLDEVLSGLPLARGLDDPNAGRSVVFITGTSRTADIEQILVRGVHGPGQVHAILVEESCFLSP